MTVILQGVVGSTAYGLATSDSDVDRLGVYVASTRKILGFGLDRTSRTRTTVKPDLTIHELGHFADLTLTCRPSVLELLYLSAYDVETHAGHDLRLMREDFLSHLNVRSSYTGYAVDQARRLLTRSRRSEAGFGTVPVARTEKHARHCFRLLLQGEELLRTGQLRVRLLPWEVERCWEMGAWAGANPEAFHDAMVAKAATFEEIRGPLPEHPNADGIEEWVVGIRVREMAGLLAEVHL